MNQNSNSSRFFVAMVGALIVVGATWKVRHPNDATRMEASRSIASLRADPSKQARIASQTSQVENKARGSFNVSITADDGLGGAVDPAREPVTRAHLKGKIVADRHIAAHDYTWIVPQNYKVIDGATSGTVPELRPGQSHEVRITVDRGAEPAQPVVLHVFKIIQSEPRGQVAQFDMPDSTTVRATETSREKTSARLRDEKYIQ